MVFMSSNYPLAFRGLLNYWVESVVFAAADFASSDLFFIRSEQVCLEATTFCDPGVQWVRRQMETQLLYVAAYVRRELGHECHVVSSVACGALEQMAASKGTVHE